MRWILLMCLLMPLVCFAKVEEQTAKGFHWYSLEEKEREVKVQKSEVPKPVKKLEPYDELLKVRKSTLNKLAESILRPSTDATKSYIEAQTKMAKRHQEFVRNWQRVLLTNPELDHRLHFPTDNNAIATRNDKEKLLTEEILNSVHKKFGLIFIYQGDSALSKRFAGVFLPFIDKYQLSVIPVSVTERTLTEFPSSKHIPIEILNKKIPIKKQYLPAVMLVNLKTKEMSPLSYGYVALSDLKARFLDVATDFKRFSYEGLGGLS